MSKSPSGNSGRRLRALLQLLLNFAPWLFKGLPETPDPLIGPWLVSKTETLFRILFSLFLLNSHVSWLPSLPPWLGVPI